MECVDAALKTSFRKEMAALKSSTQQPFLDDFLAVNLQNGGASSDDFSVDELFDFSNGDGFSDPPPEEEEEDERVPIKAGLVSLFAVSPRKQNPLLSLQSPNFNFESGELVVPTDEEKDLEWLSHFVEDSNSESSTPFPAGAVLTEDSKTLPSDPEKPPKTTSFKSPIPSKARSKRERARAGGRDRVWYLTGTPSLTESSSSSTSSSSSCTPPSPWLIYAAPSSGSFSPLEPGSSLDKKPPAKKLRKKVSTDSAGGGGCAAQPQRRCSHCGVTKTPQWRAGPLGAKTLCNACGVRFKSGRLLPEYRPACSPTFSTELYSNHHRKVLEMRRMKDVVVGPVNEDAGPSVPVLPSFL